MFTAVMTSMPASRDLEHVLVPLFVAASRDIRVRQLVDHAELRLARQIGVEIHFFEDHAPVLDLPARHDLQVTQLGLRLRAAVGLDESDDDVDAVAPKACASSIIE